MLPRFDYYVTTFTGILYAFCILILAGAAKSAKRLEHASPGSGNLFSGPTRILATLPVEVHDGNQFATVLADENVELIWIAAAVVDVPDTGWSLPVAINLTRNVTVMGSPRFVNNPVLRLNYVQKKVRLNHGVSLTFKNVVLEGLRRDSLARAPGLDLIAAALPGGYADLIVEDIVMVLPVCLPSSYRATNHAGMPRPDGYPPGIQLSSTRNQTGCINDTAAPALQRCWPDMILEEDLVLYGADVNEAGSPVLNNMHVVLRNSTIACATLVDVACIDRFSPVGCLLAALRNDTSVVEGVVGVTAGGGATGGSGGHGSANITLVVAVVVGVVGGLLLVVLAVLLVFRRRHCRQCSVGDFAQSVRAHEQEVQGITTVTVTAAASLASVCINSAGPMHAPKSGVLGVVPYQKFSSPGRAPTRPSTGSLPATAEPPGAMQRVDTGPLKLSDCGEMLVTSLTPHRADLQLGIEMQTHRTLLGLTGPGSPNPDDDATATDSTTAAGQQQRPIPAVVTLLPVTRGKGAFGRVMEGMYGGQRVAVKIVECWRPPQPSKAPAGAASRPPSLPPMQPPEQPQHAEDDTLHAAEMNMTDCHGEAGPHFDGVFMSDALIKAFTQEVEVLGRCEHPNVVRLLAACVTPPRLCLVMELMEMSLDKLLYGGSLHGNKLPLPKVLHIATCVCHALAYLHPTVVHRDLKPGNVLIGNPSSDTPDVKLGDFGLSRLRVTVAPTTSPDAGTPPYMAPECFDLDNTTITHKADMFSLGVLLWEMLSGARPWADCNAVVIAFQVCMVGTRLPLTAIHTSRCSTRLQQIMTSCWDADPVRRPAAAEVAKELADMLEACNRGTFRSFETGSLSIPS